MSDTRNPVQEAVTDPVCGMKIDPRTAAGMEGWKGSSYHFCSSHCRTKFRGNPGTYATPAKSSSGR